jgi:DNA-binding transcriptional ArsR family regulator
MPLQSPPDSDGPVENGQQEVGIRYKMQSGDSMRRGCNPEAEDQIFEMQVRICKAFANSTRLRMLDLLAKREHTVSDLQSALGITLPNVSQHLSILRAAGVVTTRRDGKQIYCSLTLPEVKEACQLIRNVLRAQLRNDRKLVV